ncbi:cytochrome C oxidase subunit IV family protein [Paraflavisolibacter sp. H34]|uniref:cytochrome C oxidase subunit IV family protein n=1 Tax=Huijunlia imazamoxiresistens TaxID=3127457 RepID=UPI003018F87D
MDQHSSSTYQEVTYHHDPLPTTSHIWRTFWILLGLTVVELVLGFVMYAFPIPHWIEMFMKGVIVVLTLAKAFYIVSEFMHLGSEIRNMIMTIVVPLLLFIWFIAAFLWDGNEYRVSRNRYNRVQETSVQHVAPTAPSTQERKTDTSAAGHPLD